MALLAATLGGWSWSFTVHGPSEFYDVRHFRVAEKAARADFVACISDFCRTQIMSLVGSEHWGKLEVVHCGVDPEVFRACRSRQKCRRRQRIRNPECEQACRDKGTGRPAGSCWRSCADRAMT